MRGKLGRWLRDGVIMLGIAVGLLVLLELGLRLYMGPPAYRYDDEVIVSLVPNASKIFIRSVDGGPRFIRWSTNSDGFRGPDLKDSPRLRVMVYGDSNVDASFSTQEETITGQLERLLRETVEPEAEVINAAMIGYGPDQNLIRLEAQVDRYAPDAVVFHVFTENDFGDIVRNRLFELDAAGNLVRTGLPVTLDARMPASWWSRPSGELFSNSMISIFANALVQGLARSKEPHPKLEHDPEGFRDKALRQHQREFEVYRAGAPRRYSMFSDHYEADIAFAPDSESARTKRALLAAVLERANEIARERAIPFLVLIQPASRDLTTNLPNHQLVLQGLAGYDRRRLDAWVAAICDEAGLDFINLFDVFEATGKPDDLYFPSPDPHWNEEGQLVAAQAVAEWVRRSLR
jgi:lysophospholipase L1-like esterase